MGFYRGVREVLGGGKHFFATLGDPDTCRAYATHAIVRMDCIRTLKETLMCVLWN